jgi:hypothetical protein
MRRINSLRLKSIYGRHMGPGDAVCPVFSKNIHRQAVIHIKGQNSFIQEGLSRLKNFGAKGCCPVGHPPYYRKFGFENVDGLVLEGVPQEVFFALSFDGRFPHGTVTLHEGFKADGRQA